jgi:protein-tyrosine phosphatase
LQVKKHIKSILRTNVKIPLVNLYWRIRARNIRNPGLPDSPGSILFICKGNICRSPFAERLMMKMFKDKEVPDLFCYSAGLEVNSPESPPAEAICAAKRFGIDHHDHQAKMLVPAMMEKVDMIFAVEVSHLELLRRIYPQFYGKIYLLPLFEGRMPEKRGSYYRYNIEDPYGRSVDHYIFCFERIQKCIEGINDQMNGDSAEWR